MSDLKKVGQALANAALSNIPNIVADASIPSIRDNDAAAAAIKKITTQDKPAQSLRVWTAGVSVASIVATGLLAALGTPELKEAVGPWGAVLAASITATLPLLSKAKDARPTE